MKEDVRMDGYIYGPSIPHLKVNTVRRNIQNVEPVKITSVPKTILDKYKEFTICFELIHINGIIFLNAIEWHIMFATGSIIKNRKVDKLQMGSHRYINYTCGAVSRSIICTLIVSSDHYASK